MFGSGARVKYLEVRQGGRKEGEGGDEVLRPLPLWGFFFGTKGYVLVKGRGEGRQEQKYREGKEERERGMEERDNG